MAREYKPCEWHIVYISDDEVDQEIEIYHPTSCPFEVAVGLGGPGHHFRHACFVGYEIENAGYDLFLQDIQYNDSVHGIGYVPGWYRIRGGIYEIPGGPWGGTEYDAEAERQKIQWVETKTKVEIEKAEFD